VDFHHEALFAVFFADVFDGILDPLDFGFLEFPAETLLDRALVDDSGAPFAHSVNATGPVVTSGWL
jgi:hypothetical protein